MEDKRPCTVEGCPNELHARGYCKKHYGHIWRYGRIIPEDELQKGQTNSSPAVLDVLIRDCKSELTRAQETYKIAIGLECRMRWHKTIIALEERLAELCRPKRTLVVRRVKG